MKSQLSRDERRSTIEHELKSPKEYTLVPFRGSVVKAEVIRVPVGLPLYRVHNGRTRVEQLMYVDRAGLDQDFFQNSEEDADVQEAQGSILLRMSKDPKGNIYLEMARVAEQRAPLIATRSGVVVNGNRRLAAMRDLFNESHDTYAKFEYVDLAILPPEANERDIEDIETELQEVPETKLDYGWVERRLKMRYQLEELKVDRAQLRAKYKLRSEEDVSKELAQLALAEEYLNYIGRPSYHYWDVAQGEEIFKRLQTALGKYADKDADVRRLIGFALIKSSADKLIKDRVYRFHPIFGDDFEKVIERYVEQFIETAEAASSTEPAKVPSAPSAASAVEDPLQDFIPPEDSRLDRIKDSLQDPEAAGEIAKDLVSIYKTIDAEQEEEDVRRAAFISASSANRLLQEISLDGADPSTFAGLRAQLLGVVAAAQRLMEQMPS